MRLQHHITICYISGCLEPAYADKLTLLVSESIESASTIMTSPGARSQRDWDRHIENFLRQDTGFLGGCHDLSWQPLRRFLANVRDSNPYTTITHFPKNSCRILYDSIARDGARDRKVLNDKQLFQHVCARIEGYAVAQY